jgi:RimJ/RimL family protein N-acetyltransferase
MTSFAISGPVIETERLILRVPEARDATGSIAYQVSDRSIFTGGPKPEDQAWRMFASIIGHWAIRGWGLFAVQMKSDDQACGMVGPWMPHGWVEQEIGWTLWDGRHEGLGVAHEAALAARAWSFETLGWTTAVSYIDPQNARSIALAERIGARLDPEAKHGFGDEPCLVYRHPAPEGQQ